MLLKTGVTLELLAKDKGDIYLMVEQGIRGGISIALKRHAKSDNNNTLMYLDANNLYGWAMSLLEYKQIIPPPSHVKL